MPHGKHTAADYYPRRLYQREIQNPYTVFHSFFDACPLPQALGNIDGWLKAVTANNYWKKSYPANLLHFYEMMERLVEAAYLINKLDNRNAAAVLAETPEPEIDLMVPASYYGWQTKYSAWDYFPRSLNKKQFINPYIAFKKFFKYQDMPVWREVLYDLLYNAFVGKMELELGEYDMLAVQKHLKRLVEAAHLVEVRTRVRVKEKKEKVELNDAEGKKED